MQSFLSAMIREQLTRYLSGEISLQEFQRWFISATWEVEQSNDRTAEWLAHTIELRLAEYTNGDWTEQELKDWLWPLGAITLVVGPQILKERRAFPIVPSPNTIYFNLSELIFLPPSEPIVNIVSSSPLQYGAPDSTVAIPMLSVQLLDVES